MNNSIIERKMGQTKYKKNYNRYFFTEVINLANKHKRTGSL